MLADLAGAAGCAGAILALANVDPQGCRRARQGDGDVQRALINGHRGKALAGIAGLKRALCALQGTSPVTRFLASTASPSLASGRAMAKLEAAAGPGRR